MPEVRPLKKPTKSNQGEPVKTEVARTTREPTILKFSQSAMRGIGQQHAILTAVAPRGMTFENALVPEAWGPVAMRAARPREWIGSDIIVHSADYKWRAHLQILAIVKDAFKQPCGVQVACIGPSVDPKTGKCRPVEVATGLPWFDPKEAEEAA